MKLRHSLAAFAALTLGGLQAADAAVSFSVDLNLDMPGIQNTTNAAAGEEIRGAVVLDITDNTTFNAYDVSLRFLQSELQFGPNSLSGFVSDAGGARNVPIMTNRVNLGAKSDIILGGNDLGDAFNLAPLTEDNPAMRPMDDMDAVFDSFGSVAGQTGGDPASSPNPTLFQGPIGNIYLFSLTSTGVSGGLENIVLVPADRPFLGETNLGDVFYNGASVSTAAVPEPTSLLALAATTGLIALRRRRR